MKFAEDLVQTQEGPVLTTLVSVSSYATYLVDRHLHLNHHSEKYLHHLLILA